MKKFIKLDYYYVVDNKTEIKEGDWYIFKNSIYQSCSNGDKIISYKVIATTNPNLPLPQIANASDELVGKEVEVVFYPDYTESPAAFEYGTGKEVCRIKPISKETSAETLEETAEQYAKSQLEFDNNLTRLDLSNIEKDWLNGYKHCEKTMYSESEVLELLDCAINNCYTNDEVGVGTLFINCQLYDNAEDLLVELGLNNK